MELKEQLVRYWHPAQSLFIAVSTAVCGVMLAQATWLIIEPAADIEVPRIAAASNSDSKSNSTDWLQLSREVASREFFGTVVQEDVAPVDEKVEAPETSLAFTLQAVIAQGEGSGFAVIAQRSGTGKVFGVGSDLYGQAKLSAVYGDRVIIDRNGKLETLRYEKVNSEALLRSVAARDDDVQAETFQEALNDANRVVSSGGDVRSQVQEMMGYVSQRANENPEAFVNEMGLEVTDGGYQVTRRARQLQMVGLRPGDIVTAVNDSPVGNIAADQMMLNQIMQSGGEVKIQIRRGSRSFTIYQSIPTF
ncbi:MAG: type II secretion system protein N [Reinekea sp.]|jgi:general secretion pathway protein C